MQQHLKRLDRIIAQAANARNQLAQNPEVELDVEPLLQIAEVAVQALADEIEEELK